MSDYSRTAEWALVAIIGGGAGIAIVSFLVMVSLIVARDVFGML